MRPPGRPGPTERWCRPPGAESPRLPGRPQSKAEQNLVGSWGPPLCAARNAPIELRVLDKCFAQLLRASDPVGIDREQRAARAESIKLGMIDANRRLAGLGKLACRVDQA